jgi:transposase
LIAGIVGAANCGDRNGLEALLYFHHHKYLPKKIFADQGYTGDDMKMRVKRYGIDLETVKRRDRKGFAVEARRWILERTFAWIGKFLRLSKDYQQITNTSMRMIYLAMSRLMLLRIKCLA